MCGCSERSISSGQRDGIAKTATIRSFAYAFHVRRRTVQDTSEKKREITREQEAKEWGVQGRGNDSCHSGLHNFEQRAHMAL